jgi:hypothetical protein
VERRRIRLDTADKYSHQELCRESNLSLALLKEIMAEEEVSEQSGVVTLNGIPIEDHSGKKLLVYGSGTVKKRRKKKDKYVYFNAFSNRDHLEMVVDKMHEYHENIGCIEIEDLDESKRWFSAKLKNIDNKVMKEIRVFDTEGFTKEKGIANLLMNYFNVV